MLCGLITSGHFQHLAVERLSMPRVFVSSQRPSASLGTYPQDSNDCMTAGWAPVCSRNSM